MNFLEISGSTAVEEACARIPQSNRLIICGDAEEREYLENQLDELDELEMSVESILEEADSIDVLDWFSERWDECVEDYDADEAQLLGVWPTRVEKQGFVLNTDLTTGQPLDKVFAVEVAVLQSWQLPAFFNVGGWNDCPDAELHCAVWRYWQETYGAHIIGISHDVIEAKVLRPPKTEEQAIELAWQHYLYCRDIVEQGMQTISNLAATLKDHDSWYFWWD